MSMTRHCGRAVRESIVRIKAKLAEKAGLLKALPLGVLAPALLLTVVGIAFIFSASTDFTLSESSLGVGSGFHLRQAAFACLGLLIMICLAVTPQRWLSGGWPFWIVGGMLMLGAVMVFGRTINGAKSWISLGPIALQPSELCKPLLCVALAGFLRFRRHIDSLGALLACIAITGLFFVPILMQPDFGTSMVFIPMVGAMFWVAGGNRLYMWVLGLIGAAAFPSAYVLGLLKPHQVKRIDVYLSSVSGDVMDKTGDGYHMMQSMTAIGSGGFTGKGFGEGTQSQLAFLPERHTDFIFAVYAEETGLVGVALFLLLFFVLLERMLAVARDTREPFSRLLVVGIATMFFTQVAINIGMACGIMPITGLTLPFVSYGGSSLLTSFVGLGLVANVAVQPQRVMGREVF